jgi:hypothetical protein
MFNVGDTVRSSEGDNYTVTMERVSILSGIQDVQVDGIPGHWFHRKMFTLVIPSTPKLTGMTQFFKDMKEKKLNEASI